MHAVLGRPLNPLRLRLLYSKPVFLRPNCFALGGTPPPPPPPLPARLGNTHTRTEVLCLTRHSPRALTGAVGESVDEPGQRVVPRKQLRVRSRGHVRRGAATVL